MVIVITQKTASGIYVTYTNLGRAKMQALYDQTTAGASLVDGHPFYEPLPALGEGSGLNHLKNAADIATAIGVTDYGNVSFITSTSPWVQTALQNTDQGMAYREALVKLRPFAVEDGAYDNASGQLALYDPAAGTGALTELYLQDRSAMLAWKMTFRNAGATPDTSNAYSRPDYPTAYHFEDQTSKLKINLGSGAAENFRSIVFGDNNANTLIGQTQADHLYGGAGDDTLTGNGGDDYLEGGAGTDTYVYQTGDGLDTLLDTDGQGHIQWGALTIHGDTGVTPEQWKELSIGRVWQDQQNNITYTLQTQADGSKTLFISREGDTLKVEGWKDGNLGITLGAGRPAPVTTQTYIGDQRAPLNDTGTAYNWSATHWAVDGTLIGGVVEANFNDVITGSGGAERILGLGGNDALDGGAGNDQIEGGEGDDLIGGGAGSDTLWGGAGNDQILSATGLSAAQRKGPADLWQPPAGRAVLVQGSTWGVYDSGNNTYTIDGGGSLTPDTAPDVIFAGEGDDSVTAGRGADYIDGGLGNDTLWGHGGNDLIEGGAGDDVIVGDGLIAPGFYETTPALIHGNDFLDGGAGSDIIVGGGEDDVLLGGAGADFLWGDEQNETRLAGQYHGNDYLDGGEGNDQLVGGGKDDTLFGGAGDDRLFGDDEESNLAAQYHGNDYLDGGEGNDTLVGEGGNDTLVGGTGNDTLIGGEGDDYLDGGDGDDRTASGGGLAGGAGNDTLLGGTGQDELLGGDGDDTLDGGDGADLLFGGSGLDTLRGGGGRDTYIVNLGGGIDTIDDFVELGFSGIQIGNTLRFGLGIQQSDVSLGIGSLLLKIGDGGDAIHIQDFDPDHPYANPVIDRFEFADGSVLGYEQLLSRGFDLNGTPDADIIQGTGADDRINALESNDTVYAKAGNDTVDGGEGDDLLYGQAGDDLLDGGAGLDTMAGGAGDDVYKVDDVGDTASENLAEGADRVESAVSFTLSANVENLTLTGTAELDGVGNELDNLLIGNDAANRLHGLAGNDALIGNAGSDRLDGGSGADVMTGGAGDDLYEVDDAGDRVNEAFNEGTDTVRSTLSYALPVNVENLVLTGADPLDGAGNALDNLITGNEADNALFGGDGNDRLESGAGDDSLDGASGNDTLLGGAGDDLYTVDAGGDSVIENPDEGADTVRSAISYTLGANLENLTLTGAAELDGAGNTLDNVITGNAAANRLYGLAGNDQLNSNDGNDLLDGGVGADTLVGGAGDDVYRVDDAGDTVVEAFGAGSDTVESMISHTLSAQVENLTLSGGAAIDGFGNTLNNRIIGNLGDNLLLGQAGADWIFGNDGDDTLDGGDDADTLGGGAGNDTLLGGAGDDTLDGSTGNDVMNGGLGNDVYRVDSAGDITIEALNAGHDTVYSSVTHTLGAAVEDLTLTGWDAIDGAGNELDNVLIGNNANNVLSGLDGNDLLDGGHGDDRLLGGTGDDRYQVDSSLDVIVENVGEGIDTAASTASYTLSGQVENLQLVGDFAFEGVGNELNNRLYGNARANLLSGEAGNDYVDGREGNDMLYGGAGYDFLYGGDDGSVSDGGEEGNGGFSNDDFLDGGNGADWLIGGSGNDVLYGGRGNDILYGDLDDDFTGYNDGADYGILSHDDFLDGGEGIDTLEGGIGNDIYIVDGATRLVAPHILDECDIGSGDDDPGPTLESTADTVIENPGEGYDVVYSSVSLTLPDNVEELHFTGTANIDVVGNSDFNFILGNAGNNRIDGGQGADWMEGGVGDDTYFVDTLADTVVEQADGGVDTVRAYVDGYALGNQVENLDLVATVVSGYGNELDNRIRGNAADNRIFGGAGNDLLTGAGGNDSLQGGADNDTYVFGAGFGQDIVIDEGGDADAVLLNGHLTLDDISLTRSGDDVVLGLKNSTDQLVLKDWFTAGHRVESIHFCDGQIIDSSAIDRAVNNRAPDALDDGAAVKEDELVAVSGSVLANDTDPDPGAGLLVTNPGSYLGTYGTLLLNAEGSYTYTLANGSFAIQSLAQGQSVSERFNYAIRDDDPIRPLGDSAALTLTIGGSNDAPTLEQPIADQTGREGDPLIFAVPANTFGDIDQGDVLTLSAALADGSPLPNWLGFDAATATFHGTPGSADGGAFQLQVVATDTGGLSASGVFTLAIADSLAQGQIINGTGAADILNGSARDDIIDGKAGNDRLFGNSGNDILNGGAGIDYLAGGAGDDIYYVDGVCDAGKGNEGLGNGLDAPPPGHIINQNDFPGTSPGHPGSLGGPHTNNAGGATRTGTAGGGTLFCQTDTVLENAGNGYDILNAAVTFSLPDHVEELRLLGSSNLDGYGNAEDNMLVGNSAANTLTGGAGNDTLNGAAGADTLIGGAGNDTLTGGLGDDTYRLGRGYGADTLIENDATVGNTDIAQFLAGVTADQLWFLHPSASNNLEVRLIGTPDKLIVKDWYLGAANHVEQFKTTDDSKTLLESQVQNLVSAMASFAPPAAGQTTLPTDYRTALNSVIAANWH